MQTGNHPGTAQRFVGDNMSECVCNSAHCRTRSLDEEFFFLSLLKQVYETELEKTLDR